MKLPTQTDVCLPSSMLVEFQQAYNPAVRQDTKLKSFTQTKASVSPGSSHPAWKRKKGRTGREGGWSSGFYLLQYLVCPQPPHTDPKSAILPCVGRERWGETYYLGILIIYCG